MSCGNRHPSPFSFSSIMNMYIIQTTENTACHKPKSHQSVTWEECWCRDNSHQVRGRSSPQAQWPPTNVPYYLVFSLLHQYTFPLSLTFHKTKGQTMLKRSLQITYENYDIEIVLSFVFVSQDFFCLLTRISKCTIKLLIWIWLMVKVYSIKILMNVLFCPQLNVP